MAAFQDPEVMAALQDGNVFVRLIPYKSCHGMICVTLVTITKLPYMLKYTILYHRISFFEVLVGDKLICTVDIFAVMKNPANLAKHQANPKVAPLIAKMMNKFGGPK